MGFDAAEKKATACASVSFLLIRLGFAARTRRALALISMNEDGFK